MFDHYKRNIMFDHYKRNIMFDHYKRNIMFDHYKREIKENKERQGLIYLFNGISPSYGLFNA